MVFIPIMTEIIRCVHATSKYHICVNLGELGLGFDSMYENQCNVGRIKLILSHTAGCF